MALVIKPEHIETNIHPNWRSIGLSGIRMVRLMLKEGRQTASCHQAIKAEQRSLLLKRRKIAAAIAKAEARS